MEQNILLIDDDPDNLFLLKKALDSKGYQTLTAMNAMEGLQLLERYPVWATIVDDQMPGMTGLEFLRKVKVKYPHIIHVMVTGFHRMETVIQCLNFNLVYKFFQKPVDLDSLFETLNEMKLLYDLKARYQRNRYHQAILSEFQDNIPSDLLQIYDKFFIDNLKLIQLGQFILSLVGEIQNPLQLIKLNLEFMDRNQRYSEVSARHIRLGVKSIENVLSIIFQHLSYSVKGKREEITLRTFMEGVIEQLKLLLKEPDRFHFDILITPPIDTIYYDPAHLEQILHALISNAIEACSCVNEPQIIVKSWSDASYLFISVRDNGCGIKPEYQTKIFDPFFSTKKTDQNRLWKETISKSGLGLWLTYHIVREYGGDILFTSGEEGTEFVVQLPLKKILVKI